MTMCSNLEVPGSNPVKVVIIDTLHAWVRSSVVEHGIADPMVAGSIPVTPSLYMIIIH